MTKNEYRPFNNKTALHKIICVQKCQQNKNKPINKADFGRNFSNSGEMYKSWGVLIYDPLYFHWSTLWWSLIRRPLTKRSRGVLNFYASPLRWRLATHIVLQGCIYFILNIFCFQFVCVGFLFYLLVKKNSVKEKYVMASFSNLFKINAIFH